MFFGPGCEHCKELKPEFAKVSAWEIDMHAANDSYFAPTNARMPKTILPMAANDFHRRECES